MVEDDAELNEDDRTDLPGLGKAAKNDPVENDQPADIGEDDLVSVSDDGDVDKVNEGGADGQSGQAVQADDEAKQDYEYDEINSGKL